MSQIFDDVVIHVLPNPGVDEVRFYPFYSTICTVTNVPFAGTIEIAYLPGKTILELESFEAWLLVQAGGKYTVESLCKVVFDVLFSVLQPKELYVTVHASTTVHADVSASISWDGPR